MSIDVKNLSGPAFRSLKIHRCPNLPVVEWDSLGIHHRLGYPPVLKRGFPFLVLINVKGHFRNLNWRYLPYIRPICLNFRGYTPNIWPKIWCSTSIKMDPGIPIDSPPILFGARRTPCGNTWRTWRCTSAWSGSSARATRSALGATGIHRSRATWGMAGIGWNPQEINHLQHSTRWCPIVS